MPGIMAEVETPVEALRDRLTGLLADWGAEFSMVLKELDSKRARLKELSVAATGHEKEVQDLTRRVEGQDELIQTLKTDAEEASRLRREIHGKDVDLDRLASEIATKEELIVALRRSADSADRLKDDAQLKDQDIEQLKAEKLKSDQQIAGLNDELRQLQENSQDQCSQEAIELDAVKAELDARKTLISSLRADADRLGALDSALEDKRNVIATLESSMNKQASTITELKQSISNWQNRYAQLKAQKISTDATSPELPALSDTDVRAIESLQSDDGPEQTIAIDMRESLLEARRSSHEKK